MAAISSQELRLSENEVELLRKGLIQWGGPARVTDEFAVAMGFADSERMPAECEDLCRALEAGMELLPRDWARSLFALEIAFASDLIGSGYEWSTSTGLSDEFTVRCLRSIQRKLAKVAIPVIRSGELQVARVDHATDKSAMQGDDGT